MAGNFTAVDLQAVLLAFVLLAPVLLAPGYLAGWLLDLLTFRQDPLSARLVLSLPLSIAFATPVLCLLGRVSFTAIWIFYLVCFAAVACIPRTRWRTPPLTIPAVWIALSTFSLVDLQLGRRLYPSAVAFDYLFRVPVVAALARASSLPPANPFFFPGHPVPFRYHYLWFLPLSLPARLAPSLISPRHALIAGTIWAGLALMALVVLYLRFFLNRLDLRRAVPIAVLLLCVSGLDILPTGAIDLRATMFHRGPFYPSVDWWNTDQLAGWLDSVLWTPHHIAGLVVCLTGFLVIYRPRQSWREIFAATFCFAAAAELSVFVALTFAVCLFVWFIWQPSRAVVLAAALAVFLALPFLFDLAAAGPPAGGILAPGVRVFKPVRLLHPPFEPFFQLLTLPLNYFLEFGFFSLVAWLKLRGPKHPTDPAAWILLAVSLLIATFVRSTSIAFNDLGARSLLIAQFVVLLWAVELFPRLRQHRLLFVTFILGLATSAYELVRLRAAFPLSDLSSSFAQSWAVADRDFGERNFQLRQTYEFLNPRWPPTALFQPNPAAYQEIYGGLYSTHGYSLESVYFSDFGGDFPASRFLAARLLVLFDTNAGPAPLCRELGLSVLVFKDTDPLWHDPPPWIRTRQPLYSNERSRAFSCPDLNGAKIEHP